MFGTLTFNDPRNTRVSLFEERSNPKPARPKKWSLRHRANDFDEPVPPSNRHAKVVSASAESDQLRFPSHLVPQRQAKAPGKHLISTHPGAIFHYFKAFDQIQPLHLSTFRPPAPHLPKPILHNPVILLILSKKRHPPNDWPTAPIPPHHQSPCPPRPPCAPRQCPLQPASTRNFLNLPSVTIAAFS